MKYDIYRLKNVKKDADRHLRSDANRDIKKKKFESPLEIGEQVLVLVKTLKESFFCRKESCTCESL